MSDMVAIGATDERSTRIWVRAATPGPHRLEIRATDRDGEVLGGPFSVPGSPCYDGTTSTAYPQDFGDRSPPLRPDGTYSVCVYCADGTMLGGGRFQTPPEGLGPDRVDCTFAFMSCHQPFGNDGNISEAASRSLAVLGPAFEERGVRRMVLAGDQVYADWPPSRSLFDAEYFAKVAPPRRESIFECTREEVRRLYQRRHRTFWQTPEYTALQARCPTTCMLDDHEIFDNFGTAPEHWSMDYEALREGAFLAYDDYQGLRTHARVGLRPPSFHHTFVHGPVACFVMDLRTQKRALDGEIRLYSRMQYEDLRRFLREQARRPVCILVLTVPLVHIPDWVARVAGVLQGKASDAEDRWSHPKADRSRRELLALLASHLELNPHQRLILVGGDIHAGMVARLDFREEGVPPMYEFVSSAVTNLETRFFRFVSGRGPRLVGTVHTDLDIPELDVRLVTEGRGHNPWSGLNFGFVRVRGQRERPTVTLELVSHDSGDPPSPRTVFETDIPPP